MGAMKSPPPRHGHQGSRPDRSRDLSSRPQTPSGPREHGSREHGSGGAGERKRFGGGNGGGRSWGQGAGSASGQRHAPRQEGDRRPQAAAATPRGAVWIYGQHAVAAALTNPARRLRRLVLTEEAETALRARLAQPWPLPAERMERGRMDQMLGRDVVHQGAALLADPLAPPSLQSVLDRPGPVVVLDQVTDPRNIGAILRSAAAFGAAGVVTQDRNAPEETGALAKAASGALETVPLLRAVNLARTLVALKAAGLWTVGLDAGAAPLLGPALAQRRVALVLGAEGSGLRRLTRDTCDEVAGLAMPGAMESLNVAAAASVALYELCRR
jgi:23S rRNA (guanosine2251-2'-O)-methyltransferase